MNRATSDAQTLSGVSASVQSLPQNASSRRGATIWVIYQCRVCGPHLYVTDSWVFDGETAAQAAAEMGWLFWSESEQEARAALPMLSLALNVPIYGVEP